jgi:nitroreductase/NAD-dependent dihydropyrimidine dehydrogenase PreA subunit
MQNFSFNETPVTISIDHEKCKNCGQCLEVCPLTTCIGLKSLEGEEAGYMCIACGNCMAVCAHGAIQIGKLLEPERAEKLPSGSETLNLIKSRRSTRTFKDMPVKREDWEKLVEAVKYSPTGHNNQFVDVIIVESPTILKKISEMGMKMLGKFASRLNNPVPRFFYRKILGEHTVAVFQRISLHLEKQENMFAQGGDPILFNAPGLMLFIAPTSELMSKNDCDLAAQTVALLAPSLRMGTCYAGIVTAAFNGVYPAIKKVIKIPEGYSVHNSLIVGYPMNRFPFISPRKTRNVTYM